MATSRAQPSADLATRYRMINSIKIKNFRCFRQLNVDPCAPINLIVGDNGTGKTTFLEAIFLALCANPQKALALRQFRGLDGQFSGDITQVAEAMYGDLFHDLPSGQPVEISLGGDGPEVRSLKVQRGRGDLALPIDASKASEAQALSVLVRFDDSNGNHHEAHTKMTHQGIEFESTGETLPLWFYFAAQHPVSSMETAGHFSALRRARKAAAFVKVFTDTFDWIEDISVETYGGAPALHASVRGASRLLPLTQVAGSINRFAAILLAVAQRQKGIVLVDEVENGILPRASSAVYARALGVFSRISMPAFSFNPQPRNAGSLHKSCGRRG